MTKINLSTLASQAKPWADETLWVLEISFRLDNILSICYQFQHSLMIFLMISFDMLVEVISVEKLKFTEMTLVFYKLIAVIIVII